MTIYERNLNRAAHFEELYGIFYDHFVAELKKDHSVFNKYRIQLTAWFFDKVEEKLRKVAGVSNVDEKRAVARAALYDALLEHQLTDYLSTAVNDVHERLSEVEASTAQRLNLVEDKLNAISKGKPGRPKKQGTKTQPTDVVGA